MGTPQSIYEVYPKRYDIPLFILASFSLLVWGLFTPVIALKQLVLWENVFSIVSGIINLYEDGHYILSSVILFFSIVFPTAKLMTLAVIWFVKLDKKQRSWALHWLGILGKWSMMDVFVVALMIVISKASGPFLNADSRYGIYIFGLSVVLAMVTTGLISKLARKAD